MTTNEFKPSEFQRSVLELLTDIEKGLEYGRSAVNGRPTENFWALWHERKGVLKAAGFEVSKGRDGYWVELCRWANDESATLNDYMAQAKVSAADREFWNDSANWHLIKKG